MVFWNSVFCETAKTKLACHDCGRIFVNDETFQFLDPNHHTIQCWHIPNYCIYCCENYENSN